MVSHEESLFQNNKFEILMDQLQSTCPPGFLKKNEENKENKISYRKPPPSPRTYYNSKQLQQEISVPNLQRRFSSQSSDPSYERPISPRASYRPPISPRPTTPTFERNRSYNKPRYLSRRIYVFNIPQNVTEPQFRHYFGQYGTLTSCGFDQEDYGHKETKSGFIAFKKNTTTDYVLDKADFLQLAGKQIRVKRATPQTTQLFVGGYDLYATKTELIGFFSQFGEVCDFVMKYNAEGVNRCFGFVTFRDSEDAVNKLVEERFIQCMKKTVEIKRAKTTKKSYTSYGGTPMTRRSSSSARFNRESLEFRNSPPPLSPRSFERKTSSSSSISGNPLEKDTPIDGTRMYSRRFFAPTRPGMGSN